MSVNINLGAWSSVFAVPSAVVDSGLKFADGVKLKVLLCLLRNSDKNMEYEDISGITGVNVTDIPEAVEYWVSMGLLSDTGEKLEPAKNNSLSESKSEAQSENNSENELNSEPDASDFTEEAESKPEIKRTTVAKPQKPDYVFTAQRLAVDDELRILVNEAQTALGKILSNSDTATLLMLKDTCGLPLDVILMLIQFCISVGKSNMRSIEKTGVEWSDDGIYSVEAADNKIRMIMQANKNFSVVSASFGLKNVGSPTKKQLDYSNKWISEWRFSPEMLREAYERCVDTKGEVKFSYIDGILKRWKSNNIRNAKELKAFEQSDKKPASKRKASYDINELNKIDTLDNF